MDVSRIRALRGPNLWSRHTAIQAIVRCDGAETAIADLPGFEARLRERFPELGDLIPSDHLDTVSVAHALEFCALGLQAQAVDDPAEVQAQCPLVLTCTPANKVVLRGALHPQVWLGAVGAFKPSMIELDPALTRDLAARGRVVVDTPEALHEAGDLLQAGVPAAQWQTLAQVLQAPKPPGAAVLFKSCGWAGWDLAAARLATPR